MGRHKKIKTEVKAEVVPEVKAEVILEVTEKEKKDVLEEIFKTQQEIPFASSEPKPINTETEVGKEKRTYNKKGKETKVSISKTSIQFLLNTVSEQLLKSDLKASQEEIEAIQSDLNLVIEQYFPMLSEHSALAGLILSLASFAGTRILINKMQKVK
jgi:hypothetical protein